MKGFLRGIAGAFVELEPVAQVEPVAAAAQKAQSPAQNATAFTPSPNALNADMVENLTAVSLKRKTSYTTFIEASKKLEAIIPDETQRIQAAFVTVSGEGRTLEQMLQAIDVHVSDVDGEIIRFQKLSDSNEMTNVDSVNQQAQSLLQENNDIAGKIATLQDQITNYTAKIQTNTSAAETFSATAAVNAINIGEVKEQFLKAAEFVKKNLSDRKQMLTKLMSK